MLLRFARDPRRGRQLQHGRPLAFAQTGDQHDLPIGEFQGVVMHVRAIHVDLPESSHLISKFTELHARERAAKRMVALHLAIECHFGAGKKAHRHIRFSDGSKTSREKVELRCHQLVSHPNRKERAMKLTTAQVERTLTQFQGEVIPENHPVVPQLNSLFGEHTFFLDSKGLNIVEPAEATGAGAQSAKVVNLANWSDANPNRLEPHEPEPTDIVVTLGSKH